MTFAQTICGLRGLHDWKWSSHVSLTCDRCLQVVAGPSPHPIVNASAAMARTSERRSIEAQLREIRRFDEFIGEVRLRYRGGFGEWGPGGPRQGQDEFVITHVRVVDLRAPITVIRNAVTLWIGRAFSMNLASAIGADLALSGEDRKGWIPLRLSAQIAIDDLADEVFQLRGGPPDLEVRLDVIANIARNVR